MTTDNQRIMNMVARGTLESLDDAEGVQLARVSLLSGESKARVERVQQYGFSGNPPAGSEAVVIFVGGGRDHGLVISLDNRASRIFGMAAGEVSMYSDEGDAIVLKRGNVIGVVTKTLEIAADIEVVIESPKVIIRAAEIVFEGALRFTGEATFTGNLNVSGTINATEVNAPGGSVPGPKV